MEKKYIGRLTDEERDTLRGVIKKLKGSAQQVRRAHMLLKADANGPNWTEKKIAEAFLCRTKTGENVRQRLVTVGFEIALHGEKPQPRPTKNGWMASKKRRSSRCVWASLPKGSQIGRCGYWPSRSWSWPSSTRSAMRR